MYIRSPRRALNPFVIDSVILVVMMGAVLFVTVPEAVGGEGPEPQACANSISHVAHPHSSIKWSSM